MSPQNQVTSEQRIFSLLLALAASRSGATKNELLSTVHGYAQRFEDEAQRESLERQFERDKDSLRELGIPIETLDSPDAPGNNQLIRYRVSRDALELPENLAFSARELSLLRLASFAWSDSSIALDSRRASFKLAALGVDVDTELLGYIPRITASDPAFAPLQAAQAAGVIVEFSYQKPGDAQPERRTVAPLALELMDGRWHLLTWDYKREDKRVFLLSRITSSVKQKRETYEPDLLVHVEEMRDALQQLADSQIAEIDVQVGTQAEAQLRPHARSVNPSSVNGFVTLSLPYLDEAVLAEELVAFGAEVLVTKPITLRNRVIALLTEIRDMHTGGGTHHE